MKKARLESNDDLKAKEHLQQRQRAYQKVFLSKDPANKAILEDLKYFCRAENTCFDPDPRIHAVLEGRREVFLRIEQHLKYDIERLFSLYKEGA